MAKKKKISADFAAPPPHEKKKEAASEDVVKARREKDAIDFVLDFKKESLKFYKEKFDLFNYFDRLYIKGSAKMNVPLGRANLELPLAFQQVEPFVCQMTETMAGEAPYLAYDGRGPEDEDPAKQITEYTQFQLDEGDFLQSYSQYLRNLAKYGTAIEKVCWETETEEVTEDRVIDTPVIDPITKMPVMGPDGMPVMVPEIQTQTQEVKKFDGPRFYNVSIFDFFVPPSATSCDVQRLDGCVHRVWRSLSQVLSNPNYKNKEKLKRLIKSKLAEKDQVSKRMTFGADDEAKRRELEQHNSNYEEKFKGKIEVLEYWGKYCFDDNDEDSDTYTLPEEGLITIASFEGETVCLRVERNPLDAKFRPFIASNDYPIEGEFYGYGELHHIRGLIQESTALRNARLDVANMSLNRMWLVERQSGLNGRELFSAPNKIVWLNDLNGIRPLDMAQVPPSSVQELGRIDYDIQNTTEIINPRQDVSNVGAAFGGTATGVNFLSAKSNLRLLLKARLQEKTFFKPLAKILLAYNRQFVTDEMYYRAYDGQQNPYSTIGPDAFMTALDYKPSSNPSKLSNEEKKANIGYLMQTAGQIEKVAPGTNNFVALLPEMYRLAGFSHPERFVNPPQTTILMPPNGQPVDQRGAPVNVVPVDEQGQPLPPPEAGMMPTEGM